MPRKSNRRELIINTAMQRFLISGYDAATVDELCGLTSSTKGSFYHFFENKEALAVEVVNQVWHQTRAEMQSIFDSDQPAATKLSLEINRIASCYLRSDGKRFFIGCPVGSLAVNLRGRSPKLTRRLNFAMTHMRQYYVGAFAALQDSRDNRMDPDVLADRFQISLQGLSTMGKALQNHSKVSQLASALQAAKPWSA